MSRYIDKDSAIDLSIPVLCGGGNEEMAVLVEDINSAPSIDIVRCGECSKHNTHRCHMAFDLIATENDDFCSYGEREGE